MSTLNIADYLKFADLQMGVEALHDVNAIANSNLIPGKPFAGNFTEDNLTTGNLV